MQNKKGKFSKKIVVFIVGANILFSISVLFVFLKTGSEPSALVGSWFAFTTVELWNLAKIKTTKNTTEGDG